MSTRLKTALNAYGRDPLQQDVEMASPHQLVSMLYDGAMLTIARAKVLMQDGSIAEKGMAISQVIAIIESGLLPSVDVEHSGELGANLVGLYQYMLRRLLEANLRNDTTLLDEVYRLLGTLKGGWDAIGQQSGGAAQATPQAGVTTDAEADGERKPLSYGRA